MPSSVCSVPEPNTPSPWFSSYKHTVCINMKIFVHAQYKQMWTVPGVDGDSELHGAERDPSRISHPKPGTLIYTGPVSVQPSAALI